MKTVPLQTGAPWRASAVMTAMDYDVHLFTDAATGEDAIVYRARPGRADRPGAGPPAQHAPAFAAANRAGAVIAPMVVNPRRVPALTAAQGR